MKNNLPSHWISASNRGIFLKLHDSYSLHMPYKSCRILCDPSIKKCMLQGEQGTFSDVSRLPLEGSSWNSTPHTHCACPTNVTIFVLIDKNKGRFTWITKYLQRLYLGFSDEFSWNNKRSTSLASPRSYVSFVAMSIKMKAFYLKKSGPCVLWNSRENPHIAFHSHAL